MAENDSAPGTWGHHNLKTAADVRRMLRGEAAPTESSSGEAIPPTPAIPSGAVSATVETVDAEPMRTVETVEIVAPAASLMPPAASSIATQAAEMHAQRSGGDGAPAVPKRSHSKKVS